MANLHVNIDHVATLRQARRAAYPEPVIAASLCELAGADGITVHLRSDRRHIQDRDLRLLREIVQTKLNVEMAATPEMLKIALELRPDQVTLVPERPDEITTEGGLQVSAQRDVLSKHVSVLRDAGILTSIFVDPDQEQVKACHRVNVDLIEINTARYTEARTPGGAEKELEKVILCAKAGVKLGMGIAAGHGLNYQNVRPVAVVSEIEEFNIGHAIIGRAVLVGIEKAVQEMRTLILMA